MKYAKGYKYQRRNAQTYQLSLRPPHPLRWHFVTLSAEGLLHIEYGYAWDGASGPCIDRDGNMDASCVHDALYELIRQGLLPFEYWKRADEEYGRLMREHGEWPWVIKINLKGLAFAKGKHAHPDNAKKIYETT